MKNIISIKKTLWKHLEDYSPLYLLGALFSVSILTIGYADPPDPDSLWRWLAELLQQWLWRIGGVVFLIGAIIFVLGWRNHDAEQRLTGLLTAASGAMLAALGGAVFLFFGLGE